MTIIFVLLMHMAYPNLRNAKNATLFALDSSHPSLVQVSENHWYCILDGNAFRNEGEVCVRAFVMRGNAFGMKRGFIDVRIVL